MHPISIMVTDLISFFSLLQPHCLLPTPQIHQALSLNTLTLFCFVFPLCPEHFSRHLCGSVPHLLRGFVQKPPLQWVIPWTTLLKIAPLPLPCLIHRCPPQHSYTALLRWESLLYSLTYYYGLNHGPKKDVKIPTPVPVNVTFLKKGSLQMSQFKWGR